MLILDVGCGGFPLGDVNCDLMVPGSHGEWNQDASAHKNFVKADVRALPFRSGVFDKVYCSHLLEHLEDPAAAIEELKRVSRELVIVIVPYAGFRILDPFWRWRSYPEWRAWEKKHHIQKFWGNPFHVRRGSWRFRWLYQRKKTHEILKRKNKLAAVVLLAPIPFETITFFEVAA